MNSIEFTTSTLFTSRKGNINDALDRVLRRGKLNKIPYTENSFIWPWPQEKATRTMNCCL